MRVISTTLAIAAGVSAVAAASPAAAKEQLANALIMAGDYRSAERILVDQPQTAKRMPEVMINLAFVYAQTGREAEARALYLEVLRQPDVELDNSLGKSLWSREIARLGLARLASTAR